MNKKTPVNTGIFIQIFQAPNWSNISIFGGILMYQDCGDTRVVAHRPGGCRSKQDRHLRPTSRATMFLYLVKSFRAVYPQNHDFQK